MSGRWNFFCDPTAPGSGGAERLAATKFRLLIHDWHSSLLLLDTKHMHTHARAPSHTGIHQPKFHLARHVTTNAF